MNLDALVLDKIWNLSTIVQLLTILLVMHKIFSLDEIFINANSDKIWNKSDKMQVRTFVIQSIYEIIVW